MDSSLQIYLQAASITEPLTRRNLNQEGLQEIFYSLSGANAAEPDEEGNNVYIIALSRLHDCLLPKKSKIYERHIFRLIKQELGEEFEKFLFKLRKQAAKCQFSNLEEQLIDQIVRKY